MKKRLLAFKTMVLMLSFSSILGLNPLRAQCEIVVNVFSPSWGDGTTWTLTNSGGATVLSGGTYGNGYNDTQTLPSVPAGNYTFTVTSTLSDNVPNYSITLDGDVVFSGTAPASQTTVIGPIVCSPVVVPPAPQQDPSAPTCTGGSELTVSGTPGPDNTWYWQTSATGTSMANNANTPWIVYANGTYYVRAYDSALMAWSDPSSVTVTNFPLEANPPSPLGEMTACVPGTSISMPTAPADIEYYWQTTVNGTSQASPATTPLFVSSTGNVYVASYNTVTECWSNTVTAAITIQSNIPPNLIADPEFFNFCTSASPMNISVVEVPSGCPISVNIFSASWGDATTWNVTNSLGQTVLSGGPYGNGYNVTQTIPSATEGPYTLSITSTLSDNNPNYSVSVDGQVVFSGTAAANNTTVISPFSCTSIDDINWYSASTGGDYLGNTSTLNALGTSVIPVGSLGSYEFWATNVIGACESAQRTLVTVNLTDVNAELIPVDVTCNGSNNGSFALGAIECGDEPYLYSIDGGAFGAIPTDLVAGTYSVIIQDDNGFESAPITLIIEQPAPPANLTLVDANYYSADISWTSTGDETSWTVEYGLAGFTPGTGTEVVVFTNFTTLTGLTENTAYQFYVTPNCGSGAQAGGPGNFNTNAGFFTFDNQCGPGFIDISANGTNLNLTDDSNAGITLPWAWEINGQTVNTVTVGNNGGILFNTLTGFVGYTAAGQGMFPFVQDLNTPMAGGGVYWANLGTAPNRQFVVMWKNLPHWPSTTGDATFEVIVDEATMDVYYLYNDVIMDNVAYNYGADAEITLNTSNGNAVVSMNSPTYLQNNSCIRFYNALCPNPILVSNQIFQEEVILDWNAGLYGETEWTIIYGPAGFDPETEGTTLTGLTTSDANIFGLTQLTDYDAYIYAECQLDDLTSPGLLVSFQTLPWCANPTALAGTVAVDSLFATWNWTPVAGATNGGISGFNIQYGSLGFEINNGTVEAATGVDFADTVANPSFLAGGVYQYYVQAVCGTDTSNYSGPFTFVMPLTNDVVCSPEMLEADGTVYTFNNAGATVEAGEGTIAPPATGANTETGWINSTVNNSTWFTFVAPASGSVRVNNTAINYNGQAAVYEATDCADWTTFELVAANDNSMLSTSVAPNFSICGLTPGATYYLMHDGFNATTGNYSISITPIVLNAGALVEVIDVCSGGSVDLFDGISGYDNGGVWTAELPSAATQLNGSDWNSAGFAYQIFNFEYRMTDGCAFDTTFAKVRVWAPSNAGTDGSVSVCRNEPFDLLSGLNGTVDLGGTWLNPSLQPIASSAIIASNIPGQFNYYYIAGNGVCPNDTALVLVNVSSTCNYLDVEELYFGTMTIMPNPSNGVFNINNVGSTEVFNYTVTDVDGRVILTKEAAINGTATTVVDLTDKVTGMYMIRVYNDNAEKVFRVIKQ